MKEENNKGIPRHIRYTVRMRRVITLSLFLISVFFLPSSGEAAHITLDAEKGTYPLRDTFYVPVRIDTQGECINAVRVSLGYNPEQLSIQEIATGESILNLWTTPPKIEKNDGRETGKIFFEGGIPGGYCGRVLGDSGRSDILVKLVVTGLPSGNEEFASTTQIVVLPETTVLLHDGGGTEASLSYAGVEFYFTQSTTSPENVWLTDVRADEKAPELFEVTLVEGPSVGNKKHYIVFNTTDKQSGVDHYEVLETDPDKFGFLSWISKESYWVEAESPYVLRDQKLRSKIMVKAVDKNGNERVVAYTPPMTPFEELLGTGLLQYALLLLVVLFILVTLFVLMRRRAKIEKRHEKNSEEEHQKHDEIQ